MQFLSSKSNLILPHRGIVIDSRPTTKQYQQDWPNSQEYGDTTTLSLDVVFVGGKGLFPL